MNRETAMRSIYAFRRNLVVAASAGTGKTHALVGVAIHLLMGGCQDKGGGLRAPIAPESLVVTTFSRKAAAELRLRLTGELEKLACGDPDATYATDLAAATIAAGTVALTPGETLARAGVALRTLGRAKVGTLHGLAAGIVREHALVAGLSPDLDLPDEETMRERAEVTTLAVLETRAKDPHVRALIELAGGAHALVETIRDILERLADDGTSAASLAVAQGDAAEIHAELQVLLTHARDVLVDPKVAGPAAAVLAAYNSGEEDRLEEAAAAFCGVSRAGKRGSAAEAFFDFRDELPGRTHGERGRGLVRRWRVKDWIVPRAEALKGLLALSEREIASANARDGVLGFSGILRAARDVLRDHPSIAAETGAALGALLIDEFQDMSGVQRDIVYLLWENVAPGGQVRLAGMVPSALDLRGEGLLVVGDRKQSIYGFRGADASIFGELAVGLAGAPARKALAIPPGLVVERTSPTAEFISLRHNYRGKPELLHFANLWSRLALVPESRPAELYEVDYVPETEDLLAPPSSPAEPVTPRTWWLRVDVPTGRPTSALLAEALVMAARIGCIVRGGELPVEGAPARFKDIAILGHTHQALAAAAHALSLDGIPHVVAGMGFHGAREVRDVVAMLACLVDPDDSLARAEVLRGPWAGATDRTLVALTDRHKGLADVEHWAVGERRVLVDPADRAAVEAVARVIVEQRLLIFRVGAGESLREAVRALFFEETLALLPRGEQRIANVQKVLALADRVSDPLLLLSRLRTAAHAEQREGEAATFSEDDDAVRLLTVHSSKGLAFPIVFLPDAGAVAGARSFAAMTVHAGVAGKPSTLVLRIMDDRGTSHDTPSFAAAKRDARRRDGAERQRQRYVAVTRARQAMFFVGDRAPAKGMGNNTASNAGLLVALAASNASCEAAGLVVEAGASLHRRVARGVPVSVVATLDATVCAGSRVPPPANA